MNIEELEKKKVDLYQQAQAHLQRHFAFMGRIEEIDDQIKQLNGKEDEQAKTDV